MDEASAFGVLTWAKTFQEIKVPIEIYNTLLKHRLDTERKPHKIFYLFYEAKRRSDPNSETFELVVDAALQIRNYYDYHKYVLSVHKLLDGIPSSS
jgi:hypothetical protein